MRCFVLVCLGLLLSVPACNRHEEAPPSPTASGKDVRPAPVVSLPFAPFSKVDENDPAALEMPRQGAEQPLVVIIEAGSYECGHTQRAEVGVQRLLAEVPEAARYYVHNPLPGHKKGYLLALAASAAQRQGLFGKFHSLLMASEAKVDEDRLLNLARKVGLDVPTFLKDMKREIFKEHVERHKALVAALGLTGTPVFIVNGRLVLGWPGYEKFAGLVRSELSAARELSARGGTIRDLHLAIARTYRPYGIVMEEGVRFGEVRKVEPRHEEWTRYRVPLGGGVASFGPDDAPVTIVEYLNPVCPHSARAWTQAKTLAEAHGGKVRVVVKLNPSESVPESLAASDAVWALGDPARSALFLDSFFGNRNVAEAMAAACPADGHACPTPGVGSPAFKGKLTGIRLEALAVGAIGTPACFINGLKRLGFQDGTALEKLIEEELELGESLAARGVAADALYAHLTGRGTTLSVLASKESTVVLGDGPRFGNASAPVQMVVFFDFASPFCRNLWEHLERLVDEIPEKLAISIKPLVPGDDPEGRGLAMAFHCLWGLGARRGLVASMLKIAGEPGAERLAGLAAKFGVAQARFAACAAAQESAATVKAHAMQAEDLGIKGAPAVFVNGRRLRPPAGLDFYSLLGGVRQALASTGSADTAR